MGINSIWMAIASGKLIPAQLFHDLLSGCVWGPQLEKFVRVPCMQANENCIPRPTEAVFGWRRRSRNQHSA